jgi:outer membrane receptor protein involved in Fe transport
VFSQPPTEFRLDEDLGNPDLTAEWADQYALGVEVQTDEATTLSAEVYYARRHDLVQRVEDVEITEDGPAPTRFDNVGLGRSYGFELMLRRETSKSSSAGSPTPPVARRRKRARTRPGSGCSATRHTTWSPCGPRNCPRAGAWARGCSSCPGVR